MAAAILADKRRTLLEAVALARRMGIKVDAPVSGPEYERVVLALHRAGIGFNLSDEPYTKRIIAGRGDYTHNPRWRARVNTLKLAKQAVHYTDVAQRSNEACWTCKYFVPSGSRQAACRLVAGTISPSGWCDRFTAATKADFAARPQGTGSVLKGPARNPKRRRGKRARRIRQSMRVVARGIARDVRRAFGGRGLRVVKRRRRNPTVGILAANPRGLRVARRISTRVEELRYQHSQDHKWYKHQFGPGVRLELLTDGSLRLVHPTDKLWERFA